MTNALRFPFDFLLNLFDSTTSASGSTAIGVTTTNCLESCKRQQKLNDEEHVKRKKQETLMTSAQAKLPSKRMGKKRRA